MMENGEKLKVTCSVLNEHRNNVKASFFTVITNTKIKLKSYFINGTKYISFQSSQNANMSFSSFVIHVEG
jgi:hypothetical protein